MYSRSINSKASGTGGIRVPKNYSGNAFSFEPTKYEPPVIRETDIVPKKEETVKETVEEPAAEEVCGKEVCESERKKDDILLGLSMEDLLIIALIVILSQNGAEDDILLLLALVLAYKK